MRAGVETAIDIAGLALIAFGVFWVWGVGWAAIVAGVCIVGVSVWRNVR